MASTVLPGFHGVNLLEIYFFIFNEIKNDKITTRANSMAFSFFLSLFPSLIMLFTLLAYLPVDRNYNEVITVYINELMPGNAGNFLLATIKDITTKPRGKLLSLGFILAIYFSSNGLVAMLQGFQKKNIVVFKKSNWVQQRISAIKMTFVLGLLLVSSFLLVIFGNLLLISIFKFFKTKFFLSFILTLLRWLVIVALFFIGIGVIYRMGIPFKNKLPIISPGAILASFLSLLTSILFSYYVENFGTYNKVYGSIGSIIVLMLWIQLNSYILLIGFELNAAIHIQKSNKESNIIKHET